MPSRSFIIPASDPFSFDECLWFLDRGFDECMHTILPGRVRKLIPLPGNPVLADLREHPAGIEAILLEGNDSPETETALRAYVEEWLAPQQDIRPFYAKLAKVPALAYMPGAFGGLRLIGIPDLFEALAWSIIGQQINLTFAYRLKRRMVERWGESYETGGEVYHIFPQPSVLAEADPAELRTMQFTGRKAEYITGVAQQFANGNISKSSLLALPGLEERRRALTDLRGIGIWSANYALMKSIRDATCIPHGDAGLLNALVSHQIISDKSDHPSMEKLYRRFKGWESYLVAYLWRSLAVKS
ncbi:hypothetical protein [Chitinophaga sp.]|uniref:DNA-3-methyladenine glycosylase family protein n=1 Tax=Chitinophaga sp. TaxID=1869181 RepID=UPI0026198F35|nr:hypothetical protein [uncultured Chitinophaga sp.]